MTPGHCHYTSSTRSHRSEVESGSILIVVMWCLVILGVICVGVLHTSRLSLRAARYHGDQTRAYYLAVAGVERAKGVIHREYLENESRQQAYIDTLADSPSDFEKVPLGRGEYRVFHTDTTHRTLGTRFGVGCEDAFLNINSCTLEELKKLEGIDVGLAAAIIDWRDGDSTPSPGGAEREAYDNLPQPYSVRNAPLLSPTEILMIQGVDVVAALGEDANANRNLDAGEHDGALSFPPDNNDSLLDGGWYHHTTLYSGVRNIDPRGKERVNLSAASASDLTAIDGITLEIAEAIVAAKDNLASAANLLDVRAAAQGNGGNANSGNTNNGAPSNGGANNGTPNPGNANSGNNPAGNNSGDNSGDKLIDATLLRQIAPYVSGSGETLLIGRININLAPREVLLCINGFSETLVAAILDRRNSNGPFESVAELLDVEGFTEALLKQHYNRFTVRSDTFYFTSEGQIPTTGARRRISCVIRFDGITFTTLSYREDS